MGDIELIDIDELVRVTGWGRATIYKYVAARKFPQPIKLGKSNRWRRKTIISWMEKQEREQQAVDERMNRLAVV